MAMGKQRRRLGDDLMLQQSGAKWIGARDPIDLSVVRVGDPTVPSGVERRRRLEAMGSATVPGEAVNILEGLSFAASNGTWRSSGSRAKRKR
jgi:hypothetical protein